MNIYVLTSGVVQSLVTSIRGQMRPLIKVTESIALLDMLLSHANLVVTNPGRCGENPWEWYCRVH